MTLALDDLDAPLGRPSTKWREADGRVEREAGRSIAPALIRRETRFGRITFGELRATKPQAPDSVIDDWMVAREVSFFAGESEAGKTFLAIDVAFRVALGLPVFGRRVKQGLVIYQIGESGDSLVKLRIPAWLAHFDPEAKMQDVPLEVLRSRVNLWTADERAKDGAVELLSAIRNIAAELGIPVSLIIIDTFSKAFTGGNENDGKDVSKVVANAEMLAKETGAHVAIIHHFPKGGSTLRGHGSLRGDVDSVAMIRVDQHKIRTITLDKLKDGVKADMQFELMQVRLGERDDGKPITSCVVLPVGEKAQKRRQEAEQSASVRGYEVALLKALFQALDSHGMSAPPALDIAPTVKVVDYFEVRRVFGSPCPMDDLTTYENDEARETASRKHKSKLRTGLKTAREFMTDKSAILCVRSCPDPLTGKSTEWAWWTGRPVRGFPRTQPPVVRQAVDREGLAADLDGVQF